MAQQNVCGKRYLFYVCYVSRRIQCRWKAKGYFLEEKEDADR